MSTPKIMFDDGSRIMESTTSPSSAEESPSSIPLARGNISLEVYYEVDRVAKEVVEKLDWSENAVRGQLIIQQQIQSNVEDTETSKAKINSNRSSNNVEDDGFLCRIALQFPDELLADAPDVSWLMEDAICNAYRDKLLLLQSQSTLQHTNISQENNEADLAQYQSSQQQELIDKHLQQLPLLFILGDTTYGSCCPDEISANHLNANVIVHYGYGCLSPTEILPVVYAFGVCNVGSSNDGDKEKNKVWKECVQMVLSANNEPNAETEDKKSKLLILYEVKYHHSINELKLQFDEKISNGNERFQEVILGKIPKQQLNSESIRQVDAMQKQGGECCGGEDKVNDNGCCSPSDQTAACCNSPTVECASEEPTSAQPSNSCCDVKDTPCCNQANQDDTEQQKANNPIVEQQQYIPRTIGGLEIPNDLDLTECTLLYIGDDLNIDSSEKNVHTRLLHILLRCSAPDGTQTIWSYSPIHHQLNTDVLNSPVSPTNDTSLSTILSRTLRRRYFLLNKTKLANTIAILIGTTSNSYSFRRLLARIRHRIQSSGRTAYTFAVGKLSTAPNKLANFAEIDAFVLIACGESIASFWQMEREEMLVPVLTPLELDVALGYREWDGRYSCDFGDLIRWDEEDGIVDESLGQQDVQQGNNNHHKDLDNTGSDSEGDDEPFFSMISGKYEQSRSSAKQKNDLESLPGQGKLIEYKSEAAEFLKQREYRGLEANVGETEVKAAVKGLVGIASNYGEKLSKDT